MPATRTESLQRTDRAGPGPRAELRGTTQAGARRARYRTMHDSLTSLPNRSFFRQRTDGALAHSEPQRRNLTVLYLDLDGFKQVNDDPEHDAGDQLLRIVAAVAGDSCRRHGEPTGGDEFACLLSDLPSREQLCHLAGEMFEAVSAPVKIGELRLTVRPSIGIAMCPADGVTTDIAEERRRRDVPRQAPSNRPCVFRSVCRRVSRRAVGWLRRVRGLSCSSTSDVMAVSRDPSAATRLADLRRRSP